MISIRSVSRPAVHAKAAFHWEYFPVFYVLPFLMASMRIPQIALAGSALRWLVLAVGCGMALHSGGKRAGKKRRFFTLTDAAIVAFIGLFFLSELWTIQPWLSVQKAASIALLYGCSFWTMWAYADQFSERKMIAQVLQTICAVLVISLLSTFVLPGGWLANRLTGLFINPNNIGVLLSLATPLALSKWILTRQQDYLLLTIVFILSFILCASRSAMLGVGVAAMFMMLALFSKRAIQTIILSLFVSVCLLLFVQTDFFATNILRESTLLTASNRTYFWELARTYIAEHPYIGHGFGTDAYIHDHYGKILQDLQLRGYGVMSSYYGLAVQIGQPLAIAFFSLLWGFVTYHFIKYRKNYTLVALLITLVSGLILSVFEPVIYSAGNVFSFLFWLVLMLAVRRCTYQKNGLSAAV